MDENIMPVFLFLGFLEGGKTTFIQRTLEDKRFAKKENVLLLICEEGVEEYELSGLNKKVTPQVIDDVSDMSPEVLSKYAADCKADCVLIEYNGMWNTKDLFEAMPDDWGLYQTILIADGSSILQYNVSFGGLVAEKLNISDLVVFNRYQNKAVPDELHKMVRMVNRRAEICYEADDGTMIPDEIEDPLPFDTDSDTVDIEDIDYALWYADIAENPAKYNGKTVNFKALAAKAPMLSGGQFAVGRYIMTCCVEDTRFSWIISEYNGEYQSYLNSWIKVRAKVKVLRNEMKGYDYPVLVVKNMSKTEPPKEEIATFY